MWFIVLSLPVCGYCGDKGGSMSKPEQQKKVFKTEVSLKYLVYLPQGYNKKGESWPLIVFLHGAGERGDDLEKVKTQGIPKILQNKMDFPFVVVSPQCPKDAWWTEYSSTLKKLIDHIKAEYNIDASRVYLTGLSMGGFGTWYMGERYPDEFAAIAPICGGGEAFLANRLKMPIWVFHGAKDDVVPVKRSQEMVDAVKAAGGDVKFTVYPELGHGCWDAAYGDEEYKMVFES
jgi:predicted peptidase